MAGKDRRRTTGWQLGNRLADSERDTRLAVIEERVETMDEETERGRVAREKYIPRIMSMERDVATIKTEILPKINDTLTDLTTEIRALRESNIAQKTDAHWTSSTLLFVLEKLATPAALAYVGWVMSR